MFVCLALAACSVPRAKVERPSLLDGLAEGPEYETPARFAYHPVETGTLNRVAALADGRELLLGERGDRWLVTASGRAEVAPSFAPERLVDAVDLGTGAWLFVGQAGGVYEAAEPLGAFARSGIPPEPLARVAVTSEALLGVTFQGTLLRSLDFGQSWLPVPLPARAIDTALLPDGRGLLLAIPERLFTTEDHGQSFEPLDVLPFGALAVERDGQAIAIDSALGPHTYLPGGVPTKSGESRRVAPNALALRPPLGASAAALNLGSAAATGGRYYEIAFADDGFRLESGPFGDALLTRDVPALRGCHDVRLAARGEQLLAVCAESEEMDAELGLWESPDGGETWSGLPLAPRGSLDALEVQLLEGGRVLLSGVCPKETSRAGCKLEGVHSLHRGKDSAKLVGAKVPTLSGTPLGLAASADGNRVYALGRRNKGNALGVFVSTDRGESFTAHDVAELELGPNPSFGGVQVLSFGVGADGYVSAVVHDAVSRQQLLLLLDEEGRFVSLSFAPIAGASIGASGLRAVALAHASGEVFESLDGGSGWQLVGRIPPGTCNDGVCPVDCNPRGCAIGNSVTRVGWEGQRESALALPPAIAPPRSRVRSVQSTAICRFDEATSWSTLRLDAVPNASSAALGSSAWFAFDSDFKDVRVDFHELPLGERPTLRTQPLLAPSAIPQGTSLFVTHQIEGAAALKQTDGRGLELAWINLLESTSPKRWRLPVSHQVRSRPTRFQARLAEPAALTIGQGGLFFANDTTRSLFSDGKNTRALSFIAWPEGVADGRDELLRAGERMLVVRFLASDAGLVWRAVDGAPGIHARTVGLPKPFDFGASQELGIAYVGDTPGLYVAEQRDGSTEAKLFPFTNDDALLGKPIAVATQSQLPAVPTPCDEPTRRTTARIVAPYEPGTRHAVIISDPAEPLPILVTTNAVLHGSAGESCAVAFDAETVGARSNDAPSALVFTDPKVPSWVFRRAPDATSEDEIELRPMRCTFDPSAEIPDEVFTAPGTER